MSSRQELEAEVRKNKRKKRSLEDALLDEGIVPQHLVSDYLEWMVVELDERITMLEVGPSFLISGNVPDRTRELAKKFDGRRLSLEIAEDQEGYYVASLAYAILPKDPMRKEEFKSKTSKILNLSQARKEAWAKVDAKNS